MVADPGIVQYVKEQVSAGFGKEQIYQALLSAGWQKEQINEAIYEIMGKKPEVLSSPVPDMQPEKEAAEAPQAPGFFWKFRNVLFHPGRFFEAAKKESGMGQSLKFFALILGIHVLAEVVVMFFAASILSMFFSSFLLSPISALQPLIFGFGLLQFFLSFFTSLGLMFSGVVIIHFFVYLLRGRKGFEQTYKALAYSSAVSLLIWPLLPLIFMFPGFYTMYFILAIAIFIGLWSLFIAVKGLSRLHEISALRALAAVLIPVMIALGIVFFTFFFTMGIFNPASYTSKAATGFGELGAPEQWQYSGTSLSITLRNQAGQDINVISVESSSCEPNAEQKTIPAGGTAEFVLSGCAEKSPGSSYSQSVTVQYSAGGVTKTASGTLAGTAA